MPREHGSAVSRTDLIPRIDVYEQPRLSTGLRKSIQDFRILDQNAMARRLVDRPLGEQVKQNSVIWLVSLGWMRPVASPDHTFWRQIDVCLRNPAHIRVGRRANFAVLISP